MLARAALLGGILVEAHGSLRVGTDELGEPTGDVLEVRHAMNRPGWSPISIATSSGSRRRGLRLTAADAFDARHVVSRDVPGARPGRGDDLAMGGVPGNQPEGGLIDRGDGSYTQVVVWDPGEGERPGVSITQPGRPSIVVESGPGKFFRYVVKFVCGTSPADPCGEAPVRPGVYATEINIMNPGAVEARIRKYVVPLVLVGAAAGREPRVSTRRAADRLVLPPHAATMDDCCRLLELLLGAPPASPMTTALTIGVLEILSTAEFDVTAVYTATGVDAGSPVDIDVVSIPGRAA
jgi:hypothetical protein